MSDELILVADERTGQVGCAILQSLYGGTVSNADLERLGEWSVSPAHMRPYRITRAKLDDLIAQRDPAKRPRAS